MRVVHLGPKTLRALAAGDLARAARTAPAPLTAWCVEPGVVRVWRMRAEQVAADPAQAAWVTGLVQDADTGSVVGRAGFHAAPVGGLVEVGYEVDPAFRRRGYARAALAALLARAAADPAVLVVRASVAPGNAPSLALVREAGFAHVGEQVDDVDGPELVWERPAG